MTASDDTGRCLIPGAAQGDVLWTDVPISFWMGVDPTSGEVIDQHHPLRAENVSGRILVLPGGRGSCSGSIGLVELLVAGHAPAALIFEHDEPILTLAVLVATEIFGKSIPVASVGAGWFPQLAAARSISISADGIEVDGPRPTRIPLMAMAGTSGPVLSEADRAVLDGAEGRARQVAMRIVLGFARLVGAEELIDVDQGHIDCCFYTGPAGLDFAERMAAWGGRVKIPTTTNSASVDRMRWRSMGIDPLLGTMSDRVGAAYVAMGARASFTCAPYLLEGAPAPGQQIAWGESNAVAYANSVLGARTMKYPDLLEVCIALTGRAPFSATHTDAGRRATLLIDVDGLPGFDDALWPLLGYHAGLVAGYDIPLLTGLETAAPTTDDLKAFSAAFATTSGSPMFHIAGVTPEAAAAAAGAPRRRVTVTRADLRRSWAELNSATERRVGLVSLGNPHFSRTEIARTAALCRGRRKAANVRLVITCGRDIYAAAAAAGHVAQLEAFGAELLCDTCWCMVDRPQLAPVPGAVMTNSGKFAHYGPGISGKPFHFGSLEACVEAACAGSNDNGAPAWLA